jgi:hypothetical protein
LIQQTFASLEKRFLVQPRWREARLDTIVSIQEHGQDSFPAEGRIPFAKMMGQESVTMTSTITTCLHNNEGVHKCKCLSAPFAPSPEARQARTGLTRSISLPKPLFT